MPLAPYSTTTLALLRGTCALLSTSSTVCLQLVTCWKTLCPRIISSTLVPTAVFCAKNYLPERDLSIFIQLCTGCLIIYFSNATIQAADGSNVLNWNFGTLVSFVDSKIMGKMKVVMNGVGPTGKTVVVNCAFENLTVKSLLAAGSAMIEVYTSTFHSLLVTEAQLSRLSSTPLALSNVSISRVVRQFFNSKQCSLW